MQWIADKIISLRKKKGWSQADLAKRIGVHRVTVAKWETGGQVPYRNLKEIAQVFSMEVIELISKEGQTLEQVVSAHPQILKDEIEAVKQERGLADFDVERIAVALAKHMTSTMKLPEISNGVPESSRQWLQAEEALKLMKWIDQQMKDLPAESDLWPSVDALSQELGRLSGLEDRPVRSEVPAQSADSDATSKRDGTTGPMPHAKSKDHASSLRPAKVYRNDT